MGLDVASTAARLGVCEDTVRAKLRSGDLLGAKTARGHWRVAAGGVEVHLEGRRARRPPRATGDGRIGLNEAARRAGVEPSYFRRLVREAPPDPPFRPDGQPRRQYLVGHKDDREHWRVEPEELARLMSQRSAPTPVPAYDLVLRAPKSVSILHALGHLVPAEELRARGLPANVAAEVAAAHREAVADALGLLERRAAWVRTPHGRTEANGLTVACFDHRSSRTGDPLLHTYAVVLNVGTAVDGRRAAPRRHRLLRYCLNGYGHQYLDDGERRRYEQALADGNEDTFVRLFGPEKISEALGEFLDYFMVRKVMAGEELLRAAGTVTKKLAKWMGAKGYLDRAAAAEAMKRGASAARDLPKAERLSRLLFDQAQREADDYRDGADDDIVEDYFAIERSSPARCGSAAASARSR